MKIKNKKQKAPINVLTAKKIKYCMTILLLLLFILIIRIAFWQFVQGAELKEKAFKQQVVSKLISPKRGNILDSTRKKFSY